MSSSLTSERRYGPVLAGYAYGWLRGNKFEDLQKLPRVESIGLEATAGIALAWAVSAGMLPRGLPRRAADHMATALLSIAAMRFGEGGVLRMQAAVPALPDAKATATVQGDDELAGALEGDDDDLAALEDDED